MANKETVFSDKDKEGLKFFLEQYEGQDFIECNGSTYYVGDDPEGLAAMGFELEKADIETTASLCTRRNVGCNPLDAKPYKEGFNLEDLATLRTDGMRIIDLEDGVLPDSNFLILNRIKHTDVSYGTSKPDHVIFDKERDAYFCIKNGCKTCDVEPVKVKSEYQVVSADISAQEPMASTLVTREPKWQEVFELKNFRYDPSLLHYMDMIAEEHLRIPKRDVSYVLFIHNTYFYERSDIYKLNALVGQSKVDEAKVPELEAHIKVILDKFNDYTQTELHKSEALVAKRAAAKLG
jgi:hypothetical protein